MYSLSGVHPRTESPQYSESEYKQIRTAFKDQTRTLEPSALALLEDARKIALLLGFHYIDTLHIVLASLLGNYQKELTVRKLKQQGFAQIIKVASPNARIAALPPDQVIPPSKATENLLAKLADPSKFSRGQKADDILGAFGQNKDDLETQMLFPLDRNKDVLIQKNEHIN